MKKQKDHWKELLPYERKFEVAAWALCGMFFLVLFLELMVWHKLLTLPVHVDIVDILGGFLIAAAQGCEAVALWRKNRSVAHVFFLMAIVFGLGTIRDIVKLFI